MRWDSVSQDLTKWPSPYQWWVSVMIFSFLYVLFELRRTKGWLLGSNLCFLRTCPFLNGSGSSLGRKTLPHLESWLLLCLSHPRRPATHSSSRFSTPSLTGTIFCESIYVTSYDEFSTLSGKCLKSWAVRPGQSIQLDVKCVEGCCENDDHLIFLTELKIQKIETNGI